MIARAHRRERLDQLLVERGLAPSRTRAQALILSGAVSSRGVRLDKAGARLAEDVPLEVRAGRRHVGRGALKLEAALADFGVRVAGRTALDVGASTGGFTQVLLEHGAERVIALDVGHGQLDWSLRRDERVLVLEGVNARLLEAADLPAVPSLATIDVSFIGLELVLPPVARCLAPGGELLALVKPQFEVGREAVGRGGIVRDAALHRRVLERVVRFSAAQGWGVLDVRPSALAGADGNREFFVHVAPGDRGRDERSLAERIERAAAAEPHSGARD